MLQLQPFAIAPSPALLACYLNSLVHMNKKIFLLILIPAVLIIGAYVYIRYSLKEGIHRDGEKIATVTNEPDSSSLLDLRPLFIQRLQQLVAKTSNNVYDLSVGDMKMDVLASTLSFQNVSLKPDKKRADSLRNLGLAPAETLAFSFENLQVEGINIDEAISSKTMDYKLVKLTNPVFEIYRNTDGKKEVKEDFTQRFLKEMEKLSVKNLQVVGGKIIVHSKGKSTVLKDVNIVMDDILIDSASRTDKNRFLFAKKARLSFKDYKAAAGKGQYNLTIAKVSVEAPEKKLTLTNLSMSPQLSKEAFVRSQKTAKEYYEVAFPSVTLSGVDWWSLMNEEELVTKEINIPAGKLSIYLNRSLPPASKMGNFPVQLLMKMPMKIKVDRVKANHLDLAYEEFNPLSQQSGTLHIKDISMDIAHVSNFKGGEQSPVTIKGTGMMMGTIPIKADFVFSRKNYQSGSFTARILADEPFQGSQLNPFAMPVGMVKIARGELQKLQASIKGDQLQASGDVSILYQDLKLELLEKDKGEAKLDRKGVTSFFANAFILKKDNPKKGDAVRTAQVEFKRIEEGGFFMLIWKVIMTGALKTVGAPTKIARKTAGGRK